VNNSQKIVFNVSEVCNYLHTSQSSIRKLIRTKQIPHYRILSRIFFDKETIDMWISNQQLNSLNQVSGD
jgi:excisionase family DNA binding protein